MTAKKQPPPATPTAPPATSMTVTGSAEVSTNGPQAPSDSGLVTAVRALTAEVKQLRERFEENEKRYQEAEPIRIEDPWLCKETCPTHSLPCRSRHEALMHVEVTGRGWTHHPQVMVRIEEHVCVPEHGEPHPWLKKPAAPAPAPVPAAPSGKPEGSPTPVNK